MVKKVRCDNCRSNYGRLRYIPEFDDEMYLCYGCQEELRREGYTIRHFSVRQELEEINPNNVKKDWKARRRDGSTVTVKDNKKGIIRLIEAPLLGDPSQSEIGSCYVNDWFGAEDPTGKRFFIKLSESQEKQIRRIEREIGL